MKTDIDSFFKKQREKVAEKQQKIVSETLNGLFSLSPHVGSDYSKGEYDANHKISINNGPVSSHHGPTHSETASKLLIDIERKKAENIKCGDSVEILNTTGHGDDVEYGVLVSDTWKRSGYRPYGKTNILIKQRNKNVLK